jgi:hypothetical protein
VVSVSGQLKTVHLKLFHDACPTTRAKARGSLENHFTTLKRSASTEKQLLVVSCQWSVKNGATEVIP